MPFQRLDDQKVMRRERRTKRDADHALGHIDTAQTILRPLIGDDAELALVSPVPVLVEQALYDTCMLRPGIGTRHKRSRIVEVGRMRGMVIGIEARAVVHISTLQSWNLLAGCLEQSSSIERDTAPTAGICILGPHSWSSESSGVGVLREAWPAATVPRETRNSYGCTEVTHDPVVLTDKVGIIKRPGTQTVRHTDGAALLRLTRVVEDIERA